MDDEGLGFWQNDWPYPVTANPLFAEVVSRAPRRRVPTRRLTRSPHPDSGVSTPVAVKIRLKRLGKIRAPYYRIVVADSRTKRDGRAIEEIGKYHPTQEPSLIEIDRERAQYWLGVGAQPTEQVMALLKITGDWQTFKGLPGTEGTLRFAAPRPDRNAIFDAASKQAALEPKEGATTARTKKSAPKADEPAADAEAPKAEAPKAEAPKADEPVAEVAKPEAPKAEAPKAEAPKAEAPEAEAPEAEAPKADQPAADEAKAEA